MSSIQELPLSEKIKAFFIACKNSQIPIEQIGYEFEKTKVSDQENKKKNGQFYTPKYIVDYMIDYLGIDETKSVIDPACGAGTFLLPILKKLYKGQALNNIYGIDIDPEALEVIRGILVLHNIKMTEKNLICGNTIVENPIISEQALCLHDIKPQEGFDVVIGNPPYITLKKDVDYDSYDDDYNSIITGPVNAASLMIAKGLTVLKDGGVLAFVLPKNILHVSSYSGLRKFLLSETTILHVVDLRSSFKNVRGEQIILFVKKEKPTSDHKIEMRIFDNEEPRESVFIPQSTFIEKNKLFVYGREEDYLLMGKLITKGRKLMAVVDEQIFRGISIPANQQTKKEDLAIEIKYVPYISGRHIQKFTFLPESYIEDKVIGNITNGKIERLRERKIIVQNIFSSEAGLIAAWDKIGVLTNETVTNVMIEDELLGKYLLAFMNTKLANYFLIYGAYNCSKMTMHTDREYIGSLPIVITEDEEKKARILEIVRSLEEDNQNQTLKQQLDQCFYSIYGLNEQEIQIVETAMEEFLSKKSRW